MGWDGRVGKIEGAERERWMNGFDYVICCLIRIQLRLILR